MNAKCALEPCIWDASRQTITFQLPVQVRTLALKPSGLPMPHSKSAQKSDLHKQAGFSM
jgi:hypothetical protein